MGTIYNKYIMSTYILKYIWERQVFMLNFKINLFYHETKYTLEIKLTQLENKKDTITHF